MKRTIFLGFSVILVFLILSASCTPAKQELPVDPYEQPQPTGSNPVSPTQYPMITDIDPDEVQYSGDIKKALNLNSSELALLQQNGFVVTDRLAWDRFLDGYAWIYSKDLPVLITTDSILHSVHQSYDVLLADIERVVIIPQLRTMLSRVQSQIIQSQTVNGVEGVDTLKKDISTYISVAIALLSGVIPEDNAAKDLYSLATAADTYKKITLFGSPRDIDFTLFKPRGHYDGFDDLERYFRAMNWLAQIDFRFVDFDPSTSQPILHPDQIVSACILRDAIDSSNQRTVWNEINTLLEAIVGASDNTTLSDLDKFMADMNFTGPADVFRADQKQMLTRLLSTDYGYQRITGQLVYRDSDNFSPEPVPRPVSFMLMGQRFTIDSYVLGNLVYDRMMKDGQPILRALPSSLDVMYSLGNDRALTHLSDEIQKYGYEPHLATMRTQVDSLPQDYWKAPFYNQWLGMIRTLNIPTTGSQYPQSMRTGAWADKMLQTQLASWAQLRHDNLLYAKQSFTGGISCEYPKGYVEPYPEFYNALYAYAQSGYQALSTISTLPIWETKKQKALNYYQNVMSVAKQLKTLSEKELALQDFNAEEETFLKDVVIRHKAGGGCGPAYTWDGWYVGMFYSEDNNPAVIADIHTNPNIQGPLAPARVLHAATGAVVPICLVAETDEATTLYIGPCFTYYDVVEEGVPPLRLTDQDWRSRLGSSDQLQHPDWTRSFLYSGSMKPEILRQ